MKQYKDVEEYIKDADKDARPVLRALRAVVKKTVPGVQEGIAYGMPAYAWKKRPLFYFSATKSHIGLYPTPGPIRECRKLIAGYSVSKGCARIPHGEKVPETVVVALIESRREEIDRP